MSQIRPIAFIIEDQKETAQLYADALYIERYDTYSSNRGADALQQLETRDAPHLILLDVNLPEVDGRQIYKTIRETSKLANTKVILTTANTYMAGLIYPELRIDDLILEKPVHIGILQRHARNLRKQLEAKSI